MKHLINRFFKKEQKDETFTTVFQPMIRDHHIVQIETSEMITESTARDHAQLRNLFGAFNLKDFNRVKFANFEIHQFVSETLILEVQIKKLDK